jgi:hypothetical protein
MGWPPTTDPQRTAPIACSLDAGGLESQEQRWAALIGGAAIERAATANGITLTFRADAGVERELRELVAVENQCCSWARWEVYADRHGELVLRARAGGAGIATLQSMFLRGV